MVEDYKCDRCGYSVSTSGPWEFYRDATGIMRLHTYPDPPCREAQEHNIYGCSARLHCLDCDEPFDLVLFEFEKPCSRQGIYDALDQLEAELKTEGKLRGAEPIECPKCHGMNLIPGPPDGGQQTCPRCKEGKLVRGERWNANKPP